MVNQLPSGTLLHSWKITMFNGKIHYQMVIFRYVSHYQRVNPIKSHKTTIFLWFSYGFPMKCVIFNG